MEGSQQPQDDVMARVDILKQQLSTKEGPIIENLVFEGGGAKGFFYSGIAKVH